MRGARWARGFRGGWAGILVFGSFVARARVCSG